MVNPAPKFVTMADIQAEKERITGLIQETLRQFEIDCEGALVEAVWLERVRFTPIASQRTSELQVKLRVEVD